MSRVLRAPGTSLYHLVPKHLRTTWPRPEQSTFFLRPALPMAPTRDDNARDKRSVLRPSPATFLRDFTLYMTTNYVIIWKRCLNYITCLTHICPASFIKDARFRLKLQKKTWSLMGYQSVILDNVWHVFTQQLVTIQWGVWRNSADCLFAWMSCVPAFAICVYHYCVYDLLSTDFESFLFWSQYCYKNLDGWMSLPSVLTGWACLMYVHLSCYCTVPD